MNSILKFVCGTLFNVLMGVVLASVVGFDPAYGAATAAVPWYLESLCLQAPLLKACIRRCGPEN